MYPSDPTTIRQVDLVGTSQTSNNTGNDGDSRDVHKHKYSHSATRGGPDLLDAGTLNWLAITRLPTMSKVKKYPSIPEPRIWAPRAASGSIVEADNYNPLDGTADHFYATVFFAGTDCEGGGMNVILAWTYVRGFESHTVWCRPPSTHDDGTVHALCAEQHHPDHHGC